MRVSPRDPLDDVIVSSHRLLAPLKSIVFRVSSCFPVSGRLPKSISARMTFFPPAWRFTGDGHEDSFLLMVSFCDPPSREVIPSPSFSRMLTSQPEGKERSPLHLFSFWLGLPNIPPKGLAGSVIQRRSFPLCDAVGQCV